VHDYSRYVAPKSTLFKGVRFRSRLEAKWAAMFDLLKVRWDYEPLDMHGWVPDFVLTVTVARWLDDDFAAQDGAVDVRVLCEVKPAYGGAFDFASDPVFGKATAKDLGWTLLLGAAPVGCGIGTLLGPGGRCSAGAKWVNVNDALGGRCDAFHLEHLWREAGSAVQWQGRRIA
jgi:hypothetical protein